MVKSKSDKKSDKTLKKPKVQKTVKEPKVQKPVKKSDKTIKKSDNNSNTNLSKKKNSYVLKNVC